MKEYIFTHPGINILFIEEYCHMPKRSLRKDRDIPAKYMISIQECITKYYSYKSQECDKSSIDTKQRHIGNTIYTIKKLGMSYVDQDGYPQLKAFDVFIDHTFVRIKVT